jgi:hypothetical protein
LLTLQDAKKVKKMKERDVQLKEQGILDDDEKEQFVINWAASALSAAAACEMKFNSKEKESERSSNSLKNKTSGSKNGSSGSGIDGNLQQLDDESDIYAACEHPQTRRLLQLLCGVTAVLSNDSNKSTLSKGKKKGSRLLCFEDTLAASDDEQQVHQLLYRTVPSPFSFPLFPSSFSLLPLSILFIFFVLPKYLLFSNHCNIPVTTTFFSILNFRFTRVFYAHPQLLFSSLSLFYSFTSFLIF